MGGYVAGEGADVFGDGHFGGVGLGGNGLQCRRFDWNVMRSSLFGLMLVYCFGWDVVCYIMLCLYYSIPMRMHRDHIPMKL